MSPRSNVKAVTAQATPPTRNDAYETLKAAFATLDISESGLELIIVAAPTPSSQKRLAHVVPIATSLGEALRNACNMALVEARNRTPRRFDPRANPVRDEASYAPNDAVDGSAELIAILRAQGIETVGAAELRTMTEKKTVKLYAVAFGAGDDRVFFVQRRVQTVSGSGKLVTRYFGDKMTLVTDPTLLLPTDFEAVLHPLGVVMLHGGDIFERLFRDDEEIEAEAREYVARFKTQFALDPASLETLNRAIKPLYMRKRIKAILGSQHFKKVDNSRISTGCTNQQIPKDVFFVNGKLTITTGENAVRFVKFLNNEVYRGEFSNELLAADGTAPF